MDLLTTAVTKVVRRRMVERFTDARGYTVYVDEKKNTFVRAHQLAALVDQDPHEVFSMETEIHHLVPIPREAGIQLDIPNSVVAIDRSEHRDLHVNDNQASVPIETVLELSNSDSEVPEQSAREKVRP